MGKMSVSDVMFAEMATLETTEALEILSSLAGEMDHVVVPAAGRQLPRPKPPVDGQHNYGDVWHGYECVPCGAVTNVRMSEETSTPAGAGINLMFCPACGMATELKATWSEADRQPKLGVVGDLTYEQLVVACANVGCDLTCGACAELFYTGVCLSGPHTCGKPNDTVVVTTWRDAHDDGDEHAANDGMLYELGTHGRLELLDAAQKIQMEVHLHRQWGDRDFKGKFTAREG